MAVEIADAPEPGLDVFRPVPEMAANPEAPRPHALVPPLEQRLHRHPQVTGDLLCRKEPLAGRQRGVLTGASHWRPQPFIGAPRRVRRSPGTWATAESRACFVMPPACAPDSGPNLGRWIQAVGARCSAEISEVPSEVPSPGLTLPAMTKRLHPALRPNPTLPTSIGGNTPSDQAARSSVLEAWLPFGPNRPHRPTLRWKSWPVSWSFAWLPSRGL